MYHTLPSKACEKAQCRLRFDELQHTYAAELYRNNSGTVAYYFMCASKGPVGIAVAVACVKSRGDDRHHP